MRRLLIYFSIVTLCSSAAFTAGNLGLLVRNSSALDAEEQAAYTFAADRDFTVTLITAAMIASNPSILDACDGYWAANNSNPTEFSNTNVASALLSRIQAGKRLLVTWYGNRLISYMGVGSTGMGSAWAPAVSDHEYWIEGLMSHPIFINLDSWIPPTGPPDDDSKLLWYMTPGYVPSGPSITGWSVPITSLQWANLWASYGWCGQSVNTALCSQYGITCSCQRSVTTGSLTEATVGAGSIIVGPITMAGGDHWHWGAMGINLMENTLTYACDGGGGGTQAQIEGIIFDDINMNGNKDGTEFGLSNVSIKIYDNSKTILLGQAISDQNGFYRVGITNIGGRACIVESSQDGNVIRYTQCQVESGTITEHQIALWNSYHQEIEPCLDPFSTCATSILATVPYFGKIPNLISFGNNTCLAKYRKESGDYAGAALSAGLMTADLATAFDPWEISDIVDIPIAAVECIDAFIYNIILAYCDNGYQCIWDRITGGNENMAAVQTACPVTFTITNQKGERLYYDSESLPRYEFDEPATIIRMDDKKLALISNPEAYYNIEIRGEPSATESDHFDLAVIYPAGDEKYVSVYWGQIPTGPEGIAVAQFGRNTIDFIIKIDTDGDGIFEQNLPPTSIFGLPSIKGFAISDDGSQMTGCNISLYDSYGNILLTTTSDYLGRYEFKNIPNGDYIVELQVPLGFSPLTDPVVPITINHIPVEVNFTLADATSGKVKGAAWWDQQIQTINDGGIPFGGYTRDSIDIFLNQVFNHFYDRLDGYGIDIENVTYKNDPPEPLTFDDLVTLFLGPCDNSLPARIEKQLLLAMLNVASCRLSQMKVITEDGATVSQSITAFAEMYINGFYDYWYHVSKINYGWTIPTGIVPLTTPNIMFKPEDGFVEVILPTEFALNQNHPNPFNPVTEISFSLPMACEIKLDVYNILGQKVAALAEGYFEAGNHTCTWDGATAASGIYLYRLEAGEFNASRKMLLLK